MWILPWNATALRPYSKHFILFVAQKAGVFGAGNVLCVRSGAYPWVEHLKSALFGRLRPYLQVFNRLERPARKKHSSLLGHLISYEENKVLRI